MISSRTSLGRTPRDRWYLFCEFVLTYFITSEYNYFSNRHTNRFLLQRKILSHTDSLTRLSYETNAYKLSVLHHEVRNFAWTFATLEAKLAGNSKWTVANFVRSGHGVRTWPAQTTKMYRTQSSCKNSCVKLRSNFLAGTTNSTAHSCRYYRYYKQIADRNSCFGGTKLYLGQCNLGGTHKSNSPDSSKQIQSYKYEIFTRRDCTHWLVSYEANKLLNLSTMEIFPDMRIYFGKLGQWVLEPFPPDWELPTIVCHWPVPYL